MLRSQRFIDEYSLSFPLLSDTTGEVASRYGIAYDEWELHRGVPRRSVFIVGADRTVRYVWTTDDAYETPDINQLGDELRKLPSTRESGDMGEV